MAKEFKSTKVDIRGRSLASRFPTVVKDRTRLNQKMMADKGLELAVSPGSKTNSMSEKEANEQLGRLKLGKQFTGTAAVMEANAGAVIEHAKKSGSFEASRDWYFRANKSANSLAKKYAVEPHQAAGVIAAMSGGGGEWETNKRNADTFIHNHVTGNHHLNVVSSFHGVESSRIANSAAIMMGAHPSTVLGDLKERNFFENINDPEGSTGTTQDQHMNNALRGWKKPWRGLGGGSTELQKPAVSELHDAITKKVGASFGLKSIEAQPVIWDAAKDIYGRVSGTPTPSHPAFAEYYSGDAVPARFHRTFSAVSPSRAGHVEAFNEGTGR
jgi:hypothetical protein